jgi:tetratricopeptide (TPR) repeat protein
LHLKGCTWLLAEVRIRVGDFAGAHKALEGKGGDQEFESVRLRLSEAETAASVGIAALDKSKGATGTGEAADHARFAEEYLDKALSSATFSASLWLVRAEAALQTGSWQVALEAARHAARGHPKPLPSHAQAQVLLITGQAYFAWGFKEAAAQNFRGCASMAAHAADVAAECVRRGEELARLQIEVKSLIAATAGPVLPFIGALWDMGEVDKRVSAVLKTAWPGLPLEPSFWGLQAAAARCTMLRRSATLEAITVIEACRIVFQAHANLKDRPMLTRLEPASLPLSALLTYATAMEALSKGQNATGSVHDALEAAQAADILLVETDAGLLEESETLAVEIKMIVARLTQRAAEDKWHQEGGGTGAGSAGENSTEEERRKKEEEKKKKPFDPYETLGIEKNASSAEVKKAYRTLALKYHPDKNSDPEAVQIFIDVQKAYELLIDPDLRKRHDAGEDVKDQDAKMKPMKFKVVEVDRERGIQKIWWYDPNTGEEGYMEQPIPKEEERAYSAKDRPLGDHCCLPEGDSV